MQHCDGVNPTYGTDHNVCVLKTFLQKLLLWTILCLKDQYWGHNGLLFTLHKFVISSRDTTFNITSMLMTPKFTCHLMLLKRQPMIPHITLEACIIEICHRMGNNYLKLNDSKTEFILIGSRQKLDKIKDLHIKIGDSIIAPVRKVWNLGVIMDDSMTLTSPVSSTLKSASFQIRNLGQIRKFSLLKPLNIWFMPLLPPVWTWEIHSFATFQRNRFIACSWNKIWPHILSHAPSLLNT